MLILHHPRLLALQDEIEIQNLGQAWELEIGAGKKVASVAALDLWKSEQIVKVVKRSLEAYALVDHWRREGLRIGLVPTMGALHKGHYSLVERSVSECDISIATIFVNPTQFGPHEDFGKYPRTFEDDYAGLKQVGADLIFAPEPAELYPDGYSTYVDPPILGATLEGECRPGHFRGVTTIVAKLFNILPATIAYFGEKDFQQLAVIKQMVEDLNMPIRVEGCETVRESDGLAMSSRNRYLSEMQRSAALSLWKTLQLARDQLGAGETDVPKLEYQMEQSLYKEGAERVEYARIVDAKSLQKLAKVDRPAVAVIAAFVGKTRLIDNLRLN